MLGEKQPFACKVEALGRLAGMRPVIKTNETLPKTLDLPAVGRAAPLTLKPNKHQY